MTQFYRNAEGLAITAITVGDKVCGVKGEGNGWIAEPVGSDAKHPMNRPDNVFVAWVDGFKTWTPIENIEYLA